MVCVCIYVCICVCVCVCVLVAQSCLTLCDPIDCSPPGSSVHGILQARILEWVAIPFSRRSSQARDWTQVNKHIFFFIFLSIMGYHRTLNTVPCALQKDLAVHSFSIYTESHLLIPNAHAYPLSPHSPLCSHQSILYVNDFVSVL